MDPDLRDQWRAADEAKRKICANANHHTFSGFDSPCSICGEPNPTRTDKRVVMTTSTVRVVLDPPNKRLTFERSSKDALGDTQWTKFEEITSEQGSGTAPDLKVRQFHKLMYDLIVNGVKPQ